MQSSSKLTQADWLEHIKQWRSTGLSQAAYCKQHDLLAYQFGYWKRKLSITPIPQNSPSAFSRVKIQTSSQNTASLSLQLADGLRIEGINQHNLMMVSELIGSLK